MDTVSGICNDLARVAGIIASISKKITFWSLGDRASCALSLIFKDMEAVLEECALLIMVVVADRSLFVSLFFDMHNWLVQLAQTLNSYSPRMTKCKHDFIWRLALTDAEALRSFDILNKLPCNCCDSPNVYYVRHLSSQHTSTAPRSSQLVAQVEARTLLVTSKGQSLVLNIKTDSHTRH